MMGLNKRTDLYRGLRVAVLIVVLSAALSAGVAVALEIPDQEAIQALQIIFKDAFHTGGGEPFKMIETVARRR